METTPLVFGFDAVCSFANDQLDQDTLQVLRVAQVKLIALRSAGFSHVDLEAASRLGLRVVRVPKYSPNAVAEYAVAMILSLDRKICRASSRIHEGNFSLEGLAGFDLAGKTVGVIGTGNIGSIFARIMGKGFGCRILACDLRPSPDLPFARYEPIETIFKESDIISLHLPLTPETHHIIDAKAFARMRPGVMVINTGRGALIDAPALVEALKSEKVGYAGLDVYEEEEFCFFRDLSGQVIRDDVLARLMTFPNVLITSHQGFLTDEALKNIAEVTLRNISDFEQGKPLVNEIDPSQVLARPAA